MAKSFKTIMQFILKIPCFQTIVILLKLVHSILKIKCTQFHIYIYYNISNYKNTKYTFFITVPESIKEPNKTSTIHWKVSFYLYF